MSTEEDSGTEDRFEQGSESNATPASEASRPVGKERTPWLVPLLMMVTLGVYLYYWLWQVTDEAESFDSTRHRSHARAKWTVGLVAGAVGTFLLAFVMLVSSVGISEVSAEAFAAGGVASIGLFMIGFFALVAGAIVLYVTLWTLWNWISHHERAAGWEALSPGVLLALMLGGAAVSGIPLVGWVAGPAAIFYAYYRTQKGFNKVWSAAREGYEPGDRAAPVGPGEAQASASEPTQAP